MGEQQPLGPEVAMQIRFGLDQLRARNAFHEFEGLCLAFANVRLGGHFVPATGPVSAGGDRGRDFTSHLRMVREDQGITFADEVAAICTTQVNRVDDKIRSDLHKMTAARPVNAVFAFLTADMPIGQIERLKHEAITDHGIRLEIFDGTRLAHSMATADFAATAYRWLRLEPQSLSAAVRATDEARQWAIATMPDSFRPDLHDYLEAVLEAGRRHPWRFVDHVPDLRTLYQPQSLGAPDGSTCVWQQAVTQSQCLVISGPAGAGKSSLLRHVAATLAEQWLTRQPQPWLPVPVRAHDLAEGKPLTQALRDGVEHVLKGLLHRPLEVDFFDREPPTTQWLILVDGLDEVRDRDQRTEVLQAVEHAARRASMRFVITSRPGVWNTDTDTFTHYTLRPLLTVDLRHLVTRWLERRGRASKTVEPWAHDMIHLLGRGGWQPTPLIAAMICVLADTDADQPEPTSLDGIYSAFVDRLITRLTRVDEPAINSVQNQIHTLLEEAASQHLLSDPDARLLDLVIASAATHGITPPAPLAADWHQTVEDVLLRSGLITKHGKELAFLHVSFEEYYAARTFPNWTPDGIVDVLADQEDSFYTNTDLVLANLSLLELLLTRTEDVDAAVAAIIAAWPSAAQTVVDNFEHHDLGERTADALTTIAADDRELLDVRAKAATALDDINPGHGVPHRLALSTDLDLDDSDRLEIISGLVRHGGEAAAAAKWLTFATLEDTVDYGWKYQAAPLVSFHVSDDDYTQGLHLIATNKLLPDRLRIAACCDLVEYNPDQAYDLIRKVTKTRWLALELVESRNEWAPTLIERFFLDDTVAFTERIQAIEWLETEDTSQARDLYESLARSTSLTNEQRNAVSSAAEHLRHN